MLSITIPSMAILLTTTMLTTTPSAFMPTVTPDFLLPACLHDLATLDRAPGLVLARCGYRPEVFTDDAFVLSGVMAPPGQESAVAKRRTEYLAGRVCARAALKRAVGLDAAPTLGADRAPCWPVEAVGAITHGHGEAAALVGDRRLWRGVGVDREQWLTPARAERLRGELLTADENDALAALSPEQRARRVTLAFSVKESLFKALYPLTGQRFYFHDAAMDGENITLLRDLSADWRAGVTLTFGNEDDARGVLSWVTVAAD